MQLLQFVEVLELQLLRIHVEQVSDMTNINDILTPNSSDHRRAAYKSHEKLQNKKSLVTPTDGSFSMEILNVNLNESANS